ncbi:MAG: GNAT family N-acetyltransferase [Thermomicrobiales bacterium]
MICAGYVLDEGGSNLETVRILTIPASRWREYRRLRLDALQDSPQAFGASYHESVTLPDEHWIGRLQEAEEGRSISLAAELDGELIGMIGAFFEAGPEVATVVAVFVQPEHRGRGVGKLLVEAVLDRLREMPGTERARLMVNVEQAPALGLYLGAGFVEIGKERVPLGDGNVYDELILERDLR